MRGRMGCVSHVPVACRYRQELVDAGWLCPGCDIEAADSAAPAVTITDLTVASRQGVTAATISTASVAKASSAAEWHAVSADSVGRPLLSAITFTTQGDAVTGADGILYITGGSLALGATLRVPAGAGSAVVLNQVAVTSSAGTADVSGSLQATSASDAVISAVGSRVLLSHVNMAPTGPLRPADAANVEVPSSSSAQVVIDSCHFADSSDVGVVLVSGTGGSVSMTDTTVVDVVGSAGAAVRVEGGTAVMDRCSISRNRVTDGGGAIHMTGGNLAVTRTLMLVKGRCSHTDHVLTCVSRVQ